jgi:hypothetical protein
MAAQLLESTELLDQMLQRSQEKEDECAGKDRFQIVELNTQLKIQKSKYIDCLKRAEVAESRIEKLVEEKNISSAFVNDLKGEIKMLKCASPPRFKSTQAAILFYSLTGLLKLVFSSSGQFFPLLFIGRRLDKILVRSL